MVARRISIDDARSIEGITIARFAHFPDGRVPVREGMYYAIVASSPAIGVAYSNNPHDGFARADFDCLMGFANGKDGTIACFIDTHTK